MNVVDLDVRAYDHDYLGRVPPAGWAVGCRPADRSWVEYLVGHYPNKINQATEWIPGGFGAATAIFFSLELHHLGEDRYTIGHWFKPDDESPWDAVETITRQGIGDDVYAVDQGLDPQTSRALVDVLGIDGEELFTCGFFLGIRAWTATGAALRAVLSFDVEGSPSSWEVPDLFFPHDRSWFAVAPYDFGWIYLASSQDLADRVRARPELTTLPCVM